MKVLLLNGSPRKSGCTYTALSVLAGTPEAEGIEAVIFQAGESSAGSTRAVAVVSARRAGGGASVDVLCKCFAIRQMPIVSSCYWNMVHGNTPDEVAQDAEGLQIMRTLARNMAWLLRSIEAGRAAGVKLPDQEARVKTNFIRKRCVFVTEVSF